MCFVGCRPAGDGTVDAPRPGGSKSHAANDGSRGRTPRTSKSDTADAHEIPASSEASDPFCDQPVYSFERDPTGASKTVGELLAATPTVVIVEPELGESDCSGIGRRHFSYVPARQNPDSFERAYRSVPLPLVQDPASAPYYLLGGRPTDRRTVDLNHVCIAFQQPVDLEVDWVLPIDDPDTVAERLRAGACPTAPP